MWIRLRHRDDPMGFLVQLTGARVMPEPKDNMAYIVAGNSEYEMHFANNEGLNTFYEALIEAAKDGKNFIDVVQLGIYISQVNVVVREYPVHIVNETLEVEVINETLDVEVVSESITVEVDNEFLAVNITNDSIGVNIENHGVPVTIIDDEMAVRVVGGKLDIVGRIEDEVMVNEY